MRRFFLPAIVLFCITLAAQAGDPAPRFTAKTMSGERFTNDTVKGKVVLLQFWATWCGYCRREQPILDSIDKEFSSQGLIVLAIDVGESKSTVKKYLAQTPRSVRVVLNDDTNLPAMFATNGFPVYVAIDAKGNIAGIQRGAAGERPLRSLLRRAGLKLNEEED